jgi:hypothetical protein
MQQNMALFDFLKKKEFQEIEQLKKELEKYKPISNIEVENQETNGLVYSKPFFLCPLFYFFLSI